MLEGTLDKQILSDERSLICTRVKSKDSDLANLVEKSHNCVCSPGQLGDHCQERRSQRLRDRAVVEEQEERFSGRP